MKIRNIRLLGVLVILSLNSFWRLQKKLLVFFTKDWSLQKPRINIFQVWLFWYGSKFLPPDYENEITSAVCGILKTPLGSHSLSFFFNLLLISLRLTFEIAGYMKKMVQIWLQVCWKWNCWSCWPSLPTSYLPLWDRADMQTNCLIRNGPRSCEICAYSSSPWATLAKVSSTVQWLDTNCVAICKISKQE